MTFDPATAYAHTWQYMPGITTTVLIRRDAAGVVIPPTYACKGVRDNTVEVDWAGLGLLDNAQTTVWHLWQAGTGAPRPANDDQIRVGDDVWLIRAVTEGRWPSEWACACVLEVANRE